MLLIVILIILAVIVLANVRTVHQGHVQIVERLGKFHDAWGAGLHVKVPFIDAVRKDVSLKEQTYDFPESQMITKDNIVIVVDSVVYSKVFDAQKYYYGIEDPVFGIENLTTTTLRSIVGSKNFDELLNGRDAINAQLKQEIDSATDPWGISITRVEVKKLQASREVQETMQKEMTAERNKRATILDAEAHQKSIITAAEGDKKAAILAAEAQAESTIKKAEADAEAIRKVAEARAMMLLRKLLTEMLQRFMYQLTLRQTLSGPELKATVSLRDLRALLQRSMLKSQESTTARRRMQHIRKMLHR